MEIFSEELLFQKTSQELTALLYDSLLDHLEEAIECIEQQDFFAANQKLQKASDILHRLGVGLRYEGNPIAENLDSLYNFAASELIEANLKKDINKISIVIKIVEKISSAWNTAMKTKQTGSSDHVMKKVSMYEKNIMRAKN